MVWERFILQSIIGEKIRQLRKRMEQRNIKTLKAMASMQKRPQPFLATVTNTRYTYIVGQVRYTPSHPNQPLNGFDPVYAAKYLAEVARVDAIGIYTDNNVAYDPSDDIMLIRTALARYDLPLINQNYILDEYHIVEARAVGASAATLTAGTLKNRELRLLTSVVHRNRMNAIVNVFDEYQLRNALTWAPQVIGLSGVDPLGEDVDLGLVEYLRRLIPDTQRVMISRPLRTLDEVIDAARLGMDALTIDAELLKDPHTVKSLKAIIGHLT